MTHTVVVWSGGLDSTVLLFNAMRMDHAVSAISIDYGQRHRRELRAAEQIAAIAGVRHTIVDLSGLAAALPGSALTDESVEVPAGHYEDPAMAATIVPNRNGILLSVAIGHAIAVGADEVAYAAHAGDHAIWPDCRPAFVDAMAAVASVCHDRPIGLRRPFIGLTKTDIVGIGATVGAPMHLTWSCYNGRDRHCGVCGTCVERREAFEEAGVADPTEYEA